MSSHAKQLPDDIESLKTIILHQRLQLSEQAQTLQQQDQMLQSKQQSLQEKEHTIIYLREQLNVLLQKRFGSSSEAYHHQLGLFNEAEHPEAVEAHADEAEQALERSGYSRQRRGKRVLPGVLPRVEVIHDLQDRDKVCPYDGTALNCIGDEISEQLDIVPASIHVLKHIRKKYACPCCQEHIITAPLTKQPIPQSQVSAGTLAWVATNKYVDGLPLYRQQVVLSRLGIEVNRGTSSQWMIRCGALVQPLINLCRDKLLEQPFIHMDETPVQVLNEQGKAAQSNSYMWLQAAGPPEQRLILYDYDPSRSQTVPSRLLQGYQGALMVDGYEGYAAVCEQNGLTRLGCFAHARRKFTEAQRASGKKGKTPKADYALKLIGKLYQLEKTFKELSPQDRHAQRQAYAKPVIEKLHQWLIQTLPGVPPKTALGKALQYLNTQWPRLVSYLDDGHYPIDNNRAENAIRPFVLGRKNWLFCQSETGANASANLYSLVETAKANGVEPYQYLKHVFSKLPNAQSLEDIEALLPWNFKNSQRRG